METIKMDSVFFFCPSSEDALADSDCRMFVVANNKEEALDVLKKNGFKENELTKDYDISRYADCFLLEPLLEWIESNERWGGLSSEREDFEKWLKETKGNHFIYSVDGERVLTIND